MTPVKTPVTGGVWPEHAVFCDQARLPVEELVYQLRHITFDLKFVLPIGCPRVRLAQRL